MPTDHTPLHEYTTTDADTHTKALAILAHELPRGRYDDDDDPQGLTGDELRALVQSRLPDDGDAPKVTTLRDLCEKLPDTHGVPVANFGDGYGYFVIQSRGTLDEYLQKQQAKRETIRENMQQRAAAFNRQRI